MALNKSYRVRNMNFSDSDEAMASIFYKSEEDLIEEIRCLFHDLRSPLAALKMFCYSLQNPADKEFINNRTERMASTINGFADKIFHQKNLFANFDLINIHSVIVEILAEKKYEYRNLDIHFVYDSKIAENNLTINGSKNEFERMLSNLINNAVEACDSSGVVRVALKQKNNSCILSVTDNGKGISDATLEKLRSGESTTYGKAHGNGIGFQQIREAVFNLNGKLKIDSKLGVGSNIVIEFICN